MLQISVLRIFPGLFKTLRDFLRPLRGVVLQTFGSGNANGTTGG